MYFSLLLNKAELWHRAVTLICPGKLHRAATLVHPLLQIFVATRLNWGNYTFPWYLWCRDLDLTWLKQPQLSPSETEAKHSRNPTLQNSLGGSWTLRKPSAGEVRGSPACWKLGQQKQTWRKRTWLSLRFQKTFGWDRRSSPLSLEGHMANKILIPLQSLISCFLEPSRIGKQQWV